jgi:hypothetical protein
LSERLAVRFHEALRDNLGTRAGENAQEFMRLIPELPEDMVARVLGESE